MLFIKVATFACSVSTASEIQAKLAVSVQPGAGSSSLYQPGFRHLSPWLSTKQLPEVLRNCDTHNGSRTPHHAATQSWQRRKMRSHSKSRGGGHVFTCSPGRREGRAVGFLRCHHSLEHLHQLHDTKNPLTCKPSQQKTEIWNLVRDFVCSTDYMRM